MHAPVSLPRAAAIAAASLFAAAVAGFGALHAGFSQVEHPVAALGASGVANAAAFNMTAFVAPGALGAFVAQALRARMTQARFVARLGVQVLTLAALAFGALGVLPLDSHDLLAPASNAHAAAWTMWWVAFAAGATLLAVGMRGTRHARTSRGVFLCAVVALAFAIMLPGLVAVGLSQRLAFAAWFVALVAFAPTGTEASSPGSPRTGRA
ncbi:DUF998 domain-containing protein [Cognatilysobacter lacus]|uniref:DUF998 domain-containing protein n=1 Tax=Cognatilysobacter lacus TaxID=1643323 RepID=A0A5D8Z4U8_9GAMM|nr:DUF998 domain-containing protein [Lysobacter lacus]TZF87714.1 DUF998 domain-containing protein [Lysobacter lacus]